MSANTNSFYYQYLTYISTLRAKYTNLEENKYNVPYLDIINRYDALFMPICAMLSVNMLEKKHTNIKQMYEQDSLFTQAYENVFKTYKIANKNEINGLFNELDNIYIKQIEDLAFTLGYEHAIDAVRKMIENIITESEASAKDYAEWRNKYDRRHHTMKK